MKKALFITVLWACLSGPANANLLVEPTFAEKMAGSTLVVIGTVTAVNRGSGRSHWGSTATLTVQQRLKGESPDTITVQTWSRVAEADPQCCVVNATYMMFLLGSPAEGRLYSFRGLYGMIRIGGPPNQIRVIPNP